MSTPSSRVLCLDVGTRRVGVAVSDPLGMTAQPLPMVDLKESEDGAAEILQLIADYDVETLVVGLPLTLSGREGVAVRRTRRFVEKLDLPDHIDVVEWDERLSTAGAERALLEGDVSRAKRKQRIDSVAASLLLQAYLASVSD